MDDVWIDDSPCPPEGWCFFPTFVTPLTVQYSLDREIPPYFRRYKEQKFFPGCLGTACVEEKNQHQICNKVMPSGF